MNARGAQKVQCFSSKCVCKFKHCYVNARFILNFQGKFSSSPTVFATAEHYRSGMKHDAASVWIENLSASSFKICIRELQNFAGVHDDIAVVSRLFKSLISTLRVMNWKYLRRGGVVVRAPICISDGVRSTCVLVIPFLNLKQETSLVLIGLLLCVLFNRIGWPSRPCTDLCLQSTTMLALQMEFCLTRVATLPSARFGEVLQF